MPSVMGKAGPAADLRRFMEKRLDDAHDVLIFLTEHFHKQILEVKKMIAERKYGIHVLRRVSFSRYRASIKHKFHLSGGRRIVGVLRGYDTFMNIVLENTVEVKGNPASSASGGQTETTEIGFVVVRGNSILYWECLDKVRA